MKKLITTTLVILTAANLTMVNAQSVVLEEQSEGSFLAGKVSMLADHYYEVARENRTRHKNLCFQLGSLAEKARGVAAYVQQSALTNTMSLQTSRPNAQVSNDGKGEVGLDAAVTNAGQAMNVSADNIQSFCEATGEDQRTTLMPYLMNLKKSADIIADKI